MAQRQRPIRVPDHQEMASAASWEVARARPWGRRLKSRSCVLRCKLEKIPPSSVGAPPSEPWLHVGVAPTANTKPGRESPTPARFAILSSLYVNIHCVQCHCSCCGGVRGGVSLFLFLLVSVLVFCTVVFLFWLSLLLAHMIDEVVLDSQQRQCRPMKTSRCVMSTSRTIPRVTSTCHVNSVRRRSSWTITFPQPNTLCGTFCPWYVDVVAIYYSLFSRSCLPLCLLPFEGLNCRIFRTCGCNSTARPTCISW